MVTEAAAICWIALYRELCRTLGKMRVRLGFRVLVPAQSSDTQMKQKNGPTGTNDKKAAKLVREVHRSQLNRMENQRAIQQSEDDREQAERSRLDRSKEDHWPAFAVDGHGACGSTQNRCLKVQWGGLVVYSFSWGGGWERTSRRFEQRLEKT